MKQKIDILKPVTGDICEYGKCSPKKMDSHSSKISRKPVNFGSQTTSAPIFAKYLGKKVPEIYRPFIIL
jgi:hypothetical protein